MEVVDADLPEVKRIRPEVFGDARGFFLESWNERTFAAAGLDLRFVQDNHSRSAQGTLRGLHYQIEQTQGKLIRVAHGSVFDVVVDLRRSSPRFGRWMGLTLSDERLEMLWVPQGFAHGFIVLSESADVLYRCTDFYAPAHERTIRWDDATLGIDWPLPFAGAPILSARDREGTPFRDAECFP